MCNFYERLLEERKRLGLSQDQMAELGNVAKRTYCNYESGAREPMAGFFIAISESGADVLYILTGTRRGAVQYAQSQSQKYLVQEDSGTILTDRERALIENYRKIKDEKDRDAIERMVKLAADVKKD